MKKQLKKIQKALSLTPTQTMYLLAAIVGFVAIVIGGWFLYQNSSEERKYGEVFPLPFEETEEEQLCDYDHPLTGECLEETFNEDIVAVMVENHVDANPLSGVAQASIVYEAPVEGSIPRLLTIFSSETEVQKLGPVRSARPYYLDWLSEYTQPMYMHVGGSPEALDNIKEYGVFDMNEFSRGWYYWRSADRYAPHNTYTSSDLWKEALERYKEEDNDTSFTPWKYEIVEDCTDNCVNTISLSYGGGQYNPEWRFNSDLKKYERYQFNRTHRDQDGTQIQASNVIVQKVEARVTDAVGRLQIDTIGSGEAIIFTNGNSIEGRWKKDSRTQRTYWVTEDGEEIKLAPGKTWVQVVSQFNTVDWE